MELQSGTCVAESILAEIAGEPPKEFHYKDKGIMAIIDWDEPDDAEVKTSLAAPV